MALIYVLHPGFKVTAYFEGKYIKKRAIVGKKLQL